MNFNNQNTNSVTKGKNNQQNNYNNSGMDTQTFLQCQFYDANQSILREEIFKHESPKEAKILDTTEYKEQKYRETQISSLYMGQHPATFPPVLDYDRIKNLGSKDQKRMQLEHQLAEISQKLRQIEIEKLSDSEIEDYNNQIINIFNKVIDDDLSPGIQKKDPHILQPKNMRILSQVLRKTSTRYYKTFNNLKKLSKEKQLDVLFGPTGTSEGGLLKIDPKKKEVLREYFKNDPMYVIGKYSEPFGPFAWKYGIFRAMTQLKAYESVTWKVNGKQIKFFQGKDYAKPENFNNKYNLLNLVKENGPLLMVQFPELSEIGWSMLGYFIELSVRTVNVKALKTQYLLFENYNIFGSLT